MKYVKSLYEIFSQFLNSIHDDIDHYTRMVSLMGLLLEEYHRDTPIDWEKIELLSYTAFFVDLGRMVYPFGESTEIAQQRAQAGVDLLHLNFSQTCSFFVDAASAVCKGFYRKDDPKPKAFTGQYAPFIQMCILCDRFDSLYFGYSEHTASEFSDCLKLLKKTEDTIEPEIFKLLTVSETSIIRLYKQQKKSR